MPSTPTCSAGAIERQNHAGSGDISYLPPSGGFLCLTAINWFVLSRERASTLESSFCSAALVAAFRHGRPEQHFPATWRVPTSRKSFYGLEEVTAPGSYERVPK